MKNISILAFLFISVMAFGQKPVTVECYTGMGIGNKVSVFRVENGKKVPVAQANSTNGYYGFKFVPEYEGFYVVGNDNSFQYPVYLKAGDAIALYMDKDTVYLKGKNTPENTVLYQWIALSDNVATKAVHFNRVRSSYKDFFPEFEAFLPAADKFKAGIKTKNPRFNELMKRSIDFEKDFYAITFLYSPRSEHPTKEQRIAYYADILNADKFKDDVVLEMPYGMDLLNRYMLHAGMEAGGGREAFDDLSLVVDNRLKGELALGRAAGLRSYFEFQKYSGEVAKYLNADQKKRMDAIGSGLYETRKGMPAAEFSYPDVDGKMVSLSDFKGKVVFVDVWATWCGPCRQELPHLKKLEEEMKGKDVVFIGVSVDELKNRDKWVKFIEDEKLPGVQLLAGPGGKISQDYKITGIPRFMVFDREGKIVEANSPRPSNPDLKALLEQELRK